MKVLDTDTCVALLRGNDLVMARRAAASDEVVTTWITAAVFYGAAKSNSPVTSTALVQQFLATLHVLGLDGASAQVFGETKALLERRGERLDDADLLIGAIATAHGAVIVTGNRRHYRRIPQLVVEDWLRPDA